MAFPPAPTTIPSLLLNICILEIIVAVVFAYRFAWSQGKFSVEAALIVLFEMME